MASFLIFIAVVVGAPALLLGLLQILTPQSSFRADLERRIGEHRYKLWQLIVAVMFCALLFSTGVVDAPIVPLMLAGLIALGFFLRVWRNEFVYLMGLRDDDFPGRYDKPIWVIALLAYAPIGLWFFRTYRRAHWPEPVTPSQLHPGAPGMTGTQPA